HNAEALKRRSPQPSSPFMNVVTPQGIPHRKPYLLEKPDSSVLLVHDNNGSKSCTWLPTQRTLKNSRQPNNRDSHKARLSKPMRYHHTVKSNNHSAHEQEPRSPQKSPSVTSVVMPQRIFSPHKPYLLEKPHITGLDRGRNRTSVSSATSPYLHTVLHTPFAPAKQLAKQVISSRNTAHLRSHELHMSRTKRSRTQPKGLLNKASYLPAPLTSTQDDRTNQAKYAPHPRQFTL
ncbi:unnamed protein product, partial [Dicrocoelium dendriticum]